MNNVTSSDVKKLIKEFVRLTHNRDQAFSDFNITKGNIEKSFGQMIEKKVFKKAITREFRKGKNTRDNYDNAMDRLISQIYKYRNQDPLITELSTLNIKYYTYLQQKIAEITPATHTVKWLFTSSKNKESVNKAYEDAFNLINGDYSIETNRIIDSFNSLKKPSEQDVETDFKQNPFSYWKTIRQIMPDAGSRGGNIDEFDKLCNLITPILNIPNDGKSVLDQYKNKVINAVQRMTAGSLVKTLRDIPIDELNRNKAGIRINALKAAGYNTLADVFLANGYQLSSIYGISHDMANYCKYLTNEYAKKTQSTLKIKLSADVRTKESTEIISSIYQYRIKKAYYDQIMSLSNTSLPDVSNAIQNLRSAGNGSAWFFYSNDTINKLKSSYNIAKDFIEGTIPADFDKLDGQLKRDIVIPSSDVLWGDFSSNSVKYINTLESLCPGVLGNDDSVYGLPEELAREIQDEAIFPQGLLCELRRYQEWGVKYILHQGKVLLGDEMGLGKTIQAIATMVSLKNTGASHFLVVCPASVLENWFREVTERSKLRAIKIHGDDRLGSFRQWMRSGGVGVTTFETISRLPIKDDWKYDLLVVDEAHYVKNPEAIRSRSIVSLSQHTGRILFMTGTALENKVDEMINLITILNRPIADRIGHIAFLSSAPQFRETIAPVYYRRKREDVLTELPELIETSEWCVLNDEEERKYEWAILNKKFAESRRVSWNIDNIKNSCKAQRMLELIEEAANEGRKIIVFSFFLDTIKKVCDLLGIKCFGPINGSVPPVRRQQIIDDFDKAPAGSVLAAQIQAGGTGLNIQSASVVIICEPQLKPSIENQAISRAYRMGQARNVLVYRLLCKDTIDERITDILKEKQMIFNAFADKSVAAEKNAEIDEKTFGDLILEEIERINKKNDIITKGKKDG